MVKGLELLGEGRTPDDFEAFVRRGVVFGRLEHGDAALVQRANELEFPGLLGEGHQREEDERKPKYERPEGRHNAFHDTWWFW